MTAKKSKRPSRELHDAFENDVEMDLSPETLQVDTSTQPEDALAEARDRERQDLIERIRPSAIIPDRFQPRPILPVEIHRRFFGGEIDCYQAAAEWVKLADGDKGHRDRVAELVAIGDSVDEHGQIKPITGAWEQRDDGTYVFRIETGERRFWGACLKVAIHGLKEEPVLRVEAVSQPSLERQIVENRHAQPPTSVAQAREIAALLLTRMKFKPDPTLDDPYDYFRQAINLPDRKRLPRGIWNKLEPMMQLTPRRMRQVLSVLHLPTDLLEQADRYGLSDRVLQAILALPEEQWTALMEAAIMDSLTGDQISVVAEQPSSTPSDKRRKSRRQKDYARSALRGLRGFAGALSRAGDDKRTEILDTVADEIIIQEDAAKILGELQELAGLVVTRLEALREIERR